MDVDLKIHREIVLWELRKVGCYREVAVIGRKPFRVGSSVLKYVKNIRCYLALVRRYDIC